MLAFLHALVSLVAGLAGTSAEAEVGRMTPQQKAAAVVVSGLPAPPGVGGVFVRPETRHLPRPRGALVFVDQEGGEVRGLRELPPSQPASAYESVEAAGAAGLATARALRRAGVHVDFAPVLDSADGPLGSRHFRRSSYGLAFAEGLEQGGVAGCAKHFPGLGSTPVSTDLSTSVRGRVRPYEVAAFRAAIRRGIPCVMMAHAFYDGVGGGRASLSPHAYRLLRAQGFRGVAITDSMNFFSAVPVESWAPRAVRAGADMLLFTHPDYARRAVRALVPLARRGELDPHVVRVVRFRRAYGRSR